MTVKIVNKSNNELPDYATENSAGVDLRAELGDRKEQIIYPGEWCLIHTGLFISLPQGYEAQIRPRSGLAYKHGVTVLNSPGTIDADYRGEICVILINHALKDEFVIHNGDRIAQMVFAKCERAYFEVVESLDETERGDGGFGHTGVE